jgi:hypothetical protein
MVYGTCGARVPNKLPTDRFADPTELLEAVSRNEIIPVGANAPKLVNVPPSV